MMTSTVSTSNSSNSNSSKTKPKAIFLMGPTASGKTGLAVELVQHFPLEIISVDSALVYKGMAIGTAKPDEETLLQAPHRLIDFVDPAEAYSAARFRQDALREMDDIIAAGRIPLLVGGTFLYFRALEKGLSPLPKADAEVRAEIQAQADTLGWQALHQQLEEIDPESAARIHPNDPQRLQRALEVYTLTGKSLTQLQKETKVFDFPYDLLKLALLPRERAWLHERIEQRFLLMMEQGFVAEVKRLYRRGDLDLNLPAIRAVGYRQIWEHIQGKLSYNEMLRRGIVATRQLAKRQLTWLRSEENIERIEIPMSRIKKNENAAFYRIEDFFMQEE